MVCRGVWYVVVCGMWYVVVCGMWWYVVDGGMRWYVVVCGGVRYAVECGGVWWYDLVCGGNGGLGWRYVTRAGSANATALSKVNKQMCTSTSPQPPPRIPASLKDPYLHQGSLPPSKIPRARRTTIATYALFGVLGRLSLETPTH